MQVGQLGQEGGRGGGRGDEEDEEGRSSGTTLRLLCASGMCFSGGTGAPVRSS